MTKQELKDKAHSLPLSPGVYIMMDKAGTVIYVGKSRALKNRVSQYFADLASHSSKTRAMVSQIDHFDYILADTEFEALVLENSLIKRHKPRYNILLKDDKGYPYIRLSVKDEYPRFSLSNQAPNDGARYFGPYGSRGSSGEIIRTISRALGLPTCTRKFPRDIGKQRPCLEQHIGGCAGWCREGLSAEDYRSRIRQAVRLLEGKFSDVERELEADMLRASEELRFENAAQLRDRLRAIQLLGTRQKVVAGIQADVDVVGFYRGEARSCFVVLHFLQGQLADRDTELLPTPMEEDEEEILSALLNQYYAGRGNLPRRIDLPRTIGDQESLQRLLTEAAGRKVELFVPQRGEKLARVELAKKNAADEAERATSREERQNRLMETLGSILGLEEVPHRFEAFDISNTGAADIVASMTVHVDGKPVKKDYRRFHLKDMSAPDDYASMEQVLRRRFRRYLDGDEKFAVLPDVLLMDGGAGQVGVAVQVLRELGLHVPVFGMVKDDRHRTRALVASDGSEIGIQSNQSIFALIGRIQEETHRFAITFHRQSHAKNTVASSLEQIPGVGEVRRKALLKHFKSLKAIREADYESLCQAVPKKTAQAVFEYFHPKNEEK